MGRYFKAGLQDTGRGTVCKAALERGLKRPFIGRSGPAPDNECMNHCRTLVLSTCAAVLALALASPPALAGDDHDRARAAVQAGQVLPLKTLLQRLERDHPGQVLEVELEQEDGRWIYEIKLLQPAGRLVKLEVDAATAEVLRRRESSRKSDTRP